MQGTGLLPPLAWLPCRPDESGNYTVSSALSFVWYLGFDICLPMELCHMSFSLSPLRLRGDLRGVTNPRSISYAR
jgi:hypothetical protein